MTEVEYRKSHTYLVMSMPIICNDLLHEMDTCSPNNCVVIKLCRTIKGISI